MGISIAVTLGGGFAPATAQVIGPRKLFYRMTDNAFQPKSALKVRMGEEVVFTFVNKGKVVHEAFIGTAGEQAAHEKEMVAPHHGMAMGDVKNMATLKPGQSMTLSFKFAKAGKYEVACHQPTHYKLGMKFGVDVS